jgi:hypothetical protein
VIRFNADTGAWMFEYRGDWRTLENPSGPPTARQLLALNHRGLLELRETVGRPLTKLDCARAIDGVDEAA